MIVWYRFIWPVLKYRLTGGIKKSITKNKYNFRNGHQLIYIHGVFMSAEIDEITINYEEDGTLIVKELDKEVLSKGAWTTILFRYQDFNRSKKEYGLDKYTIRRYQKRDGKYLPKSKFNISSAKQAKLIIETLGKWTEEK